MKVILKILLVAIMFFLGACLSQPDPNDGPWVTNLYTCKLNGFNCQIATSSYNQNYFTNARFTIDGTKVTDGIKYASLNGFDYGTFMPEEYRIHSSCFKSDGSLYYCIAEKNNLCSVIELTLSNNGIKTIIDSVCSTFINISKDDNYLTVSNEHKISIINIQDKSIIKELDVLNFGKPVFSQFGDKIYFKDYVDSTIKSIDLASSEITILAPHGEIKNYNSDRNRFVYKYNGRCEMMEIIGNDFTYTTLSSMQIESNTVSISSIGDTVLYTCNEGIILHEINSSGESLLRKNGSSAVISPDGSRYLYYKYEQ